MRQQYACDWRSCGRGEPRPGADVDMERAVPARTWTSPGADVAAVGAATRRALHCTARTARPVCARRHWSAAAACCAARVGCCNIQSGDVAVLNEAEDSSWAEAAGLPPPYLGVVVVVVVPAAAAPAQ
jgi:hypothetical protein